jgi:hypothetical protein
LNATAYLGVVAALAANGLSVNTASKATNAISTTIAAPVIMPFVLTFTLFLLFSFLAE